MLRLGTAAFLARTTMTMAQSDVNPAARPAWHQRWETLVPVLVLAPSLLA
ncbi:MAG: hypothetical protein JWR39_2389 [Devosia sp.]|nr:hypothetical protein [Devosia sp.]